VTGTGNHQKCRDQGGNHFGLWFPAVPLPWVASDMGEPSREPLKTTLEGVWEPWRLFRAMGTTRNGPGAAVDGRSFVLTVVVALLIITSLWIWLTSRE
jgi:hypothetical protein